MIEKAVATELRKEVASRLGIDAKDIIYAPVEQAMRLQAERSPDSYLNFTSMYRTGSEINRERYNHFSARQGYRVDYQDSTKEYGRKFKFIPKLVRYTVNSWFVTPECMDERISFFDMWLAADSFTLVFTDIETGIEYEFPVLLDSQEDNSDLEEFEKGKIYRLSTDLIVEALIPVGQPQIVKTIETIKVDIYSDLKDNDPVLEESIEIQEN